MTPRTCQCLRTKADYLPRRPQEGESAEHPESSMSFWCVKTLTCVGPDDRPVSPGECTSERECHEPVPRIETD
jgi:hypothetical protein